jgi:hypothetical protein
MLRLGVARKKKPAVPTGRRRYTGFDGEATGEHPALLALRRQIGSRFPFTHNLGTYVVRPMRGKTTPSVHGTGRAWDCGWRGDYHTEATRLIDYLVLNADALGIEMIIDYFPRPYGRGYRCDRASWQMYEQQIVSGAPGGKWIHVEIAPKMTAKQIIDHFAGKPL